MKIYLNCHDVFNRCIDDAATMLNILGGHDVMDSTSVTDKHENLTVPDDITLSDLHIGII